MVADWIRLAGGMLTIRVRGAELERFLNLCAQQRIMLYRIRRTQMDELRAELTLRDFYRLACANGRAAACTLSGGADFRLSGTVSGIGMDCGWALSSWACCAGNCPRAFG